MGFVEGRFQQEAHMSNFKDQRKADMAISVHEGLSIHILLNLLSNVGGDIIA